MSFKIENVFIWVNIRVLTTMEHSNNKTTKLNHSIVLREPRVGSLWDDRPGDISTEKVFIVVRRLKKSGQTSISWTWLLTDRGIGR
jgi:hypothetical protein